MTRSEQIKSMIDFIRDVFDLWFDDAEEAFIHGEDFPIADLQVIITLSLLRDESIFKLYKSLNEEEMSNLLIELKK